MLTTLITILLIYAAWARGGTVQSLQLVLPILGAAILAALAFKANNLKRLLRDPITWIGLLFLVLLTIQWWNAGRVHFFDPFTSEWGYTIPRVSWLPAAFSRAEAAEMLRWFFPAWALVLALRNGKLGERGAFLLLVILALNSALLALFGFVQNLAGANSFIWHDIGARCFATFGYENHAGSYFVLMSSVSIGLLLEELFGRDRFRKRHLLLWTLLALINVAGANLSHSRAGMMLSWGMLMLGIAGAIYYAGRRWRFGRWVDGALASLAFVIVAAVIVLRIGGPSIKSEVSSLDELRGKVAEGRSATLVLGDRVDLAEAAIGIWKTYPAFGCGGWGYRYLMPYELPDDDWQWASGGVGKANVHNDFLQFLAEFGAVGTGLMLLAALLILRPASGGASRRPLTAMALAGCALVVVHSMIDLPFRSPAILYAWLTVLVAASRIAAAQDSSENEQNERHIQNR